MKRIFYFLSTVLAAFLLFLIFYSSDGNKQSVIGTVSGGDGNTDSPHDRYSWMLERLKDPATGEIPPNIRRKELEFAKKLPKDNMLRSLDWLARGPYNIGGRTRAFAADILDENHLVAGATTGGVWNSYNGGQSWTRATGPEHFPSVSCMVQDSRPGKTNIWYYGTGEARGGYVTSQFFMGDGCYKSTDNGQSWQVLESTQTNLPQSFDGDWNFVNRLAVDPSVDTADIVYAATYGGIYRSTDGGISWTKKVGNASPSTYYSDLAITSTGVVYATLDSESGNKGIWRSDGGEQWTNITPWDTFPNNFDRIVIAINPQNENSVYFLGSTPGAGQHTEAFFGYEDYNSLWKYTYQSGNGSDSGGYWQNLSSGIPNNGLPFDNFYTQVNYNMMIAISPHDSNTIVLGATNLYLSTDGFTSMNNTKHIGGYWEHSHLPSGYWGSYLNHHPDQHWAFFSPNDSNVLYSANDGGIFKTLHLYDSIVSWDRLNNGYQTTQAYTVGFDRTATDDVLVAGFQDNANYYVNTSDTTAEWTMPLNGDGSYMGITPNKEFYYLSINRGKIYKMQLDNDGQVTGFNRIDPAAANKNDYLFINPLLLNPHDPTMMYVAGGRKLWRNDALNTIPLAGNHDTIFTGWSYFSDTINNTGTQISALAVSVAPPNILWYGTSNRRIYKLENANTGDPSPVQMPLAGFPAAYVSRIAVHPHHSDTVIVVFSNYNVYSLYYTIDGGDSWIKGAGNLEEGSTGGGSGPSFGCVEILPRTDGNLYFVGTSIGAFVTWKLDSMNTEWTQLGSNRFGNIIVEDIKARETDGLVVIGTYGKGIYSTHIEHVSDLFPEAGIEETVANQIHFNVFPNPVSRVLNYHLDQFSSPLNWEIMNLNGQFIRKGRIEQKDGQISVSEFAAGTYILRLNGVKQSGSHRFVKR